MYILVNDEVYKTNTPKEISAAQDAMRESDVESAPVFKGNFEDDGLAVESGEWLRARVYVTLPYEWIDEDNKSTMRYAIVVAKSVADVVDAITFSSLMDDGHWWGHADAWGCAAEKADGPDFWYMLTSCDCGDVGCNAPINPHEQMSVCIRFFFDNAKEHQSIQDALAANDGKPPALSMEVR